MQKFGALLPITALVAITIFILKELLEAHRRRAGEKRRKAALRGLLARECELNHWAAQTLRRIAAQLKELETPESPSSFSIKYHGSGRRYACMDVQDRGQFGQTPIPSVHQEQIKKNLLEIATLDKRLYEVVEAALTGLAKLDHVVESLIFHGFEDEESRAHIRGFGEYAIGVIDDAQSALAVLYRACTGSQLVAARVR